MNLKQLIHNHRRWREKKIKQEYVQKKNISIATLILGYRL